jgi:hypothetical protein
VLATLVQTRSPVHAARLSDQISGTAPLAQLATRLQTLLVLRGDDPAIARATALGQVARLVQRQAYMLAIQDAFWLVLVVLLGSVVAASFVHMRPPTPAAVAATPGAAERRPAVVVE